MILTIVLLYSTLVLTFTSTSFSSPTSTSTSTYPLVSTTQDSSNLCKQYSLNVTEIPFKASHEPTSVLNWQIFASILLLDDDFADYYMQQIQKFVQLVSANCDPSSTISVTKVIASGTCSSPVKIDSPVGRTVISSMEESDVTAQIGAGGSDRFVYLMNSTAFCAGSSYSRPADENAEIGGIVYFFISYPCSLLCENENVVTTNYENIVAITKLGYNIRFMYLQNESCECFESLIKVCQLISTCSINSYSVYTTTLLESVLKERLCYQKANRHLGTVGIVLIAVFCGGTVLILMGIGVFLLFRRLVRQNNHIRAWYEKYEKTVARKDVDHPDVVRSHWEVDALDVEIFENQIIGSGAFGQVFKGHIRGKVPLLNIHSTLNLVLDCYENDVYLVAAKKCSEVSKEEGVADILQEISFMKTIGYHSHVISMLGCISSPKNPLLLLEFCHNGDLHTFLRREAKNVLLLRQKQLVSIAWQVADGLTYLHSRDIVHRDIAARNILITKNLSAKISDFGMCRYVSSELYTSKGGKLPLKWMSIESLKSYDYSNKSDMWSYGVLLYEIFSLGQLPFSTIQPNELLPLLESGQRLEQPEMCPEQMYVIMNKCWLEDYRKRPEAQEIREELTNLLNSNDESYGYLPVSEDSHEDDTVSI